MAAVGLALIMVGAAIVTFRRQEVQARAAESDLSRPARLRGVRPLLRPRVLHRLTGGSARIMPVALGLPAPLEVVVSKAFTQLGDRGERGDPGVRHRLDLASLERTP
jgi:hypothetical protein